jgi:hypothetical protein
MTMPIGATTAVTYAPSPGSEEVSSSDLSSSGTPKGRWLGSKGITLDELFLDILKETPVAASEAEKLEKLPSEPPSPILYPAKQKYDFNAMPMTKFARNLLADSDRSFEVIDLQHQEDEPCIVDCSKAEETRMEASGKKAHHEFHLNVTRLVGTKESMIGYQFNVVVRCFNQYHSSIETFMALSDPTVRQSRHAAATVACREAIKGTLKSMRALKDHEKFLFLGQLVKQSRSLAADVDLLYADQEKKFTESLKAVQATTLRK